MAEEKALALKQEKQKEEDEVGKIQVTDQKPVVISQCQADSADQRIQGLNPKLENASRRRLKGHHCMFWLQFLVVLYLWLLLTLQDFKGMRMDEIQRIREIQKQQEQDRKRQQALEQEEELRFQQMTIANERNAILSQRNMERNVCSLDICISVILA